MLEQLARLIRDRRRQQRLSQQQLAVAAAVSRTTLSRVEQGRAVAVQMDVLMRILRALDLDPRLSATASPDPARLAARLQHAARVRDCRERHLRLAVRLAAAPRAARSLIDRARTVVELWRRNRTCSRHYVRRWAQLLALPPAELAERMSALGDWEDALFQNTPWSWVWN